jgi:hypothetical protein
MEVALSQRQLNNLVKGSPVQISHAGLTSSSPNTSLTALSEGMRKKIARAVRENRGCRVQLSPEEAQGVQTELGGGKVKIGKAFKKLGKNISKGFKKEIVDSGVGKEIARGLIDVGTDVVLPTALAGLSTYATGNPMLGEMVGNIAGTQLNKLAERYGYGLKGIALKAKKDAMTNLFKPVVNTAKQARELTNKIYKDGEKVLELPEITIRGGKIKWKKVGRKIKNTAKSLWRESKPILKHFGEQAIKMAEPMIEEGLASVAESYGIDPVTADMGIKTISSYGKKKAERGLDKYLTKKPSQSPEMALDKVSANVQERGNKLIQDAKVKGLESIQKYVPPEQRDTATEMLLAQTSKAQDALRDSVEGVEMSLKERLDNLKQSKSGRGRKVGRAVLPSGRVMPVMQGGAVASMRDDMGTLLTPFHPATLPMYPSSNLPQGQISGGSFRSYGGSFRSYGGSFR